MSGKKLNHDCKRVHTTHPHNYLAFQNWKKRIEQTHKNVRCPYCGEMEIWVQKK